MATQANRYDVNRTKWLKTALVPEQKPSSERNPEIRAASRHPIWPALQDCVAKEAEQKESSETFVIEVNNHRVSLTVPNDIVANLTGGAKARDAKRAIQPLRGQGLHHVEKKQQGQRLRPRTARCDGGGGQPDAGGRAAIEYFVTRIKTSPKAISGSQLDRKLGDLTRTARRRIHEDGELRVRGQSPLRSRASGARISAHRQIFVGPAAGIEAGETLMTIDVNGASKAADGKLFGKLRDDSSSGMAWPNGRANASTETKTEGGAK